VLRRLLATVAGTAIAVGGAAGLSLVVPLRIALALAVGAGAGVFLVGDGSAGAGDGRVYRGARPRGEQFRDFYWTAGAGAAIGLLLAWIGDVVELGRLGTALLVTAGALLVANMVFLYRRPAYEQALEES
jgi:hypothetical protein